MSRIEHRGVLVPAELPGRVLATIPCLHCGRLPVNRGKRPDAFGGADACLGFLPTVDFACCGHGQPRPAEAYVSFGDLMLYGRAARAALSMLGGDPPEPLIADDVSPSLPHWGVRWREER